MKRRRRRGQIAEVNVLALLTVLAAFVLVLTNDLEPESFLLLVTGLAIPAKAAGYQQAESAPIAAVPVPGPPPEIAAGPGDA